MPDLRKRDGAQMTKAELVEELASLRSREQRFEGILRSIADAVITIDQTGIVETFNTFAEQLLGYEAREVIGRNVSLRMPEPYHSEHDDYLRNYLRTGRSKILDVGSREVAGRRKDGVVIPIELTVGEVRNGGTRSFVGTLRDLRQRKEVEEELRQIQKNEALGHLTGGVAHDFNNLLTVISGNAGLLAAEEDSTELQEILRASARGAELIRRLLAFSRQHPSRPQPIDLANLMVRMSDLLKRTLGEAIVVDAAADTDLWAVLADPGQTEDAFLNLALNARDAMPAGGTLTIALVNARLDEGYVARNPGTVAGDYVALAISDTGVGMSSTVQRRVFEPYFSTKEVGQGSGLGLSMVYGFARQSGGHVVIASQVGRGTTVTLYLPRSAQAAPPAEDAETGEGVPRGEGELVLVIEDDPGVRALTVKMLEGLGYRVIDVAEAAGARAALARNHAVDLVLSDVVLPGGMSGPDFAAEARARFPRLKVIFISGYQAEQAKPIALAGTAAALLSKPFERQQLARAVRAALDRNDRRGQAERA